MRTASFLKVINKCLKVCRKSTAIIVLLDVLDLSIVSLFASRVVSLVRFAAEYLGIEILDHLASFLNDHLSGQYNFYLVFWDPLRTSEIAAPSQ